MSSTTGAGIRGLSYRQQYLFSDFCQESGDR